MNRGDNMSNRLEAINDRGQKVVWESGKISVHPTIESVKRELEEKEFQKQLNQLRGEK